MRGTDAELVRRVKEGDLDGYGDLVARYQKLVFAVAFHSLGDVEDARDVAQDVFVRAFVRLGQVRDPERLGSWLRQITVNECRAWRARRRIVEPLPEERPAIDAIHPLEGRMMLAAALDSLDEASRLTVILFYLHAYSLKEIASFLEEPVTTIKSRLRNARAKLRREMEETLETEIRLPEDFAERVTRIIAAARRGDVGAIKSMLETEPRLATAQEPSNQSTPLHIAASAGNAAVVELLLAHGADPNALDIGDNASPLHYAAERGWLEAVKLLVEAGADVNWNQDVHERGPLGWAVFFGTTQQEVAEYLMLKGAKPDLFAAIALGLDGQVRTLLHEDPSLVHARTSECDGHLSAVQYAASKHKFEIAKILVDAGAEIGLCEAAAIGSVERVEGLLLEGMEIASVNLALKAAVQAGRTQTARRLLEHGADPNFAPKETSVLFDAIGANDEPMAKLLLKFGANLEFKDLQWKSTPLGWQVFFGRSQTAQLAVDLGAVVDPGLIDLAHAGERGELRSWSDGTPKGYRAVIEILERQQGRSAVGLVEPA